MGWANAASSEMTKAEYWFDGLIADWLVQDTGDQN
jgi:hypothetical protein